MTDHPVPAAVAQVIAAYPDPLRDTLLELRDLVFAVAEATDGVGEIVETLKWGQPAYVTTTGTTVRLAPARGNDRAVGVYTSCQTPLVADFAAEHGERFEYDAGRGIHVPIDRAIPERELGDFVEAALTYKVRSHR